MFLLYFAGCGIRSRHFSISKLPDTRNRIKRLKSKFCYDFRFALHVARPQTTETSGHSQFKLCFPSFARGSGVSIPLASRLTRSTQTTTKKTNTHSSTHLQGAEVVHEVPEGGALHQRRHHRLLQGAIHLFLCRQQGVVQPGHGGPADGNQRRAFPSMRDEGERDMPQKQRSKTQRERRGWGVCVRSGERGNCE